MLKTYYTACSPSDRQLNKAVNKECIAWSYVENNSKLIKVIWRDKCDETGRRKMAYTSYLYNTHDVIDTRIYFEP